MRATSAISSDSSRGFALLTVALAGALLALGVAAQRAPAAVDCSSGSPKVQVDQPVDGDVLKVARVAATKQGEADTWELKYDAWFCNPTATEWTVLPGATLSLTTAGQTTEIEVEATPRILAPGQTEAGPVLVQHKLDATKSALRFAYPLPERVKVEFTLFRAVPRPPGPNGEPLPPVNETITVSAGERPVAEHVTPGPLRTYFPPFHQSDLPPGQYWSHGRHLESNFQRFGHDLGVSRYSATLGKWTEVDEDHEDDANPDVNAWYQIYDEPVYAMADGEVIGCNRGAVDNFLSTETEGAVAGGNLLWIRSGDETILYAHLKQNSIPWRLCPFSDDQEHRLEDPNSDASYNGMDFTVRAGDYLGRVGASGSSRGSSHLHIHAFRGLPTIWDPSGRGETGVDADSRPMNFIGMAVQPKDDANAADPLGWNLLTAPATLPDNSIIQGDACNERSPIAIPEGSDVRPSPAEVLRPFTRRECFGYLFSVMVQAGYRAVHIEENHVSVASVWRRADGTPWTLYRGLSAPDMTEKVADGETQGYRIVDFDSHADGSQLRYSLILARQPGRPQVLGAAEGQSTITAAIDARLKQGWRPVRVSAAGFPEGPRYTVLYERAFTGSLHIRPQLNLSQLGATHLQQTAASRALSTAEVVLRGSERLVSAAWYEPLRRTAPNSAEPLTLEGLVEQAAAQHAQGRYLRSMTHWLEPGLEPALAVSRQRFIARWSDPPRVTITEGPNKKVAVESATFRFEIDDPFARLECQLDNDVAHRGPCDPVETIAGIAPGKHKLSVWALTREGVRGPRATWTWTVSKGVTANP